MKKILIIIPFILSCVAPLHIYENCGESGLEKQINSHKEIKIEFKTIKEAERVKMRIYRHMDIYMHQENNILWFYSIKDFELKRSIFGKEYGFIREKYREQINEQICN